MESQASLHMMSRNELTPEKQETMRKSVDSTVIMTAQGTTPTTEKATVCVTDLDMFIDVHLLVDHPLHSRRATYARCPVTRGDQVNSLIINNGKINIFFWCSQASKRPICTREKLQATESKNVLWMTTSRNWKVK